MVTNILQMCFVPTVAIILNIILLLKNKTISKKITKFYIIIIIIFTILLVVDMLDFYFASLNSLNNLRYLTSLIGYSLRPVAFLIILFTLIRNDNSKKKSWILMIPAIINIALCITNPFTKLIFSFSQSNDFSRGLFGFFPFIIFAIYFIVLIYLMFSDLHGIEKTEILLVIFMTSAIILAVAIESFTSARCLLNGTGVLMVNCYFLYLNTQTYLRDDLTNLLNRKSFYNDIKNISGDMYVICVDVNNLKEINDIKGHFAGDEALITIGRALYDNLHNTGSKVYRVGGDEFIILTKLNEQYIVDSFNKINKFIESQGLSIAYGYEFFDNNSDFKTVYIKADKKMYICKEKMKFNKSLK